MEHKNAHLPFRPLSDKPRAFWEIAQMNPGVERRRAMVQYLLQQRREASTLQSIRVNQRWVLPITDPDLQVLLRRGILLRARTGGRPGKASSFKRNTELRLAPEITSVPF